MCSALSTRLPGHSNFNIVNSLIIKLSWGLMSSEKTFHCRSLISYSQKQQNEWKQHKENEKIMAEMKGTTGNRKIHSIYIAIIIAIAINTLANNNNNNNKLKKKIRVNSSASISQASSASSLWTQVQNCDKCNANSRKTKYLHTHSTEHRVQRGEEMEESNTMKGRKQNIMIHLQSQGFYAAYLPLFFGEGVC